MTNVVGIFLRKYARKVEKRQAKNMQIKDQELYKIACKNLARNNARKYAKDRKELRNGVARKQQETRQEIMQEK